MAHPPTGRGRLARDVGNHRLRQVGLDELRCLLLSRPADLPNKDDHLRLLVLLKQPEGLHEVGSDDGVAANADAGALPFSPLRDGVDDLVGQGA